MHEFRMPSLGADMETGTLVEWLKKPGDAISRGDIVAVVETEKGAIEIEIFVAGVLDKWLAQEGEMVPVGMPLALIATEGEAPEASSKPIPIPPPPQQPTPAPATQLPAEAQKPAPPVAPPPKPMVQSAAAERIKASPAARAYARTHGSDLATLAPGTPGGAILRADAERGAGASPTTPAPARKSKPGIDFDKMRHAIAAAMTRSKCEIPHYYISTQINLRRATQWLSDTNASRKPEARLLMNVLLLKAVAHAVKAYPAFNGFYLKDGFAPAEGVHIGPAIAIRGGGLIAPAIHDCDRKTLDEIMTALRDLVSRVRAGSLRSSEISDPTLTVTALGERGVDTVFGVIYPPQVAIVGFGAPRLTPVAHADGGLVAETVISASLAADHRVTDGRLGARFLSEIAEKLQEPENL
ncbi:MAG: pyruvate dehydrogenase E2 component (dihydrolipoamide acetyltransferase) [Alphaproteobacteria bacterium]|nr:pyruvate dehydrogenase E2 component (dihydrolipoamide acetyltransferase) [Alphaproteobacteria bacterium]